MKLRATLSLLTITTLTIAAFALLRPEAQAQSACTTGRVEWRRVRNYATSQELKQGQNIPVGVVIAGDLYACDILITYYSPHTVYRQNLTTDHTRSYIWWTNTPTVPAIPGVWRYVGFFRQRTLPGLNVIDGLTVQTGDQLARFTWNGTQ